MGVGRYAIIIRVQIYSVSCHGSGLVKPSDCWDHLCFQDAQIPHTSLPRLPGRRAKSNAENIGQVWLWRSCLSGVPVSESHFLSSWRRQSLQSVVIHLLIGHQLIKIHHLYDHCQISKMWWANVRILMSRCLNFDDFFFGKVTQHCIGEMRNWLGKCSNLLGKCSNLLGKRSNLLGKRSKFVGEMKQMDGEMKQNVLGRCPIGKVK